MKKAIALSLVAVMLLSGCSNVSQEDYNSVVSERDSLKSQNNSLNSKISSLESDCNSLQSENSELKSQNKESQTSEDKSSAPNTKGDFAYSVVNSSGSEIIINPETMNYWYYYKEMSFVSYADENNLSEKSDDKIVTDFLSDAVYCLGKANKSLVPIWAFNICKKDGETIGSCMITRTSDTTYTSMKWYGEYERLNSNLLNKKINSNKNSQ